MSMGAKKIAALDLDRLQEVLDYDPETGVLSWRIRLSPRCRLKGAAGYIGTHGYRAIGIDKIRYLAHHLAWFHFYGIPPKDTIDHKNLKRRDNRIANLREATSSENSRNQRRSAANTTGFKGVARFYNPRNRARYRAQVRANGKRLFLGLFHTPEEAYAAYCKKAKELHGVFCRVK